MTIDNSGIWRTIPEHVGTRDNMYPHSFRVYRAPPVPTYGSWHYCNPTALSRQFFDSMSLVILYPVTSMPPLPSLLLVLAWLAPVFALPHPGAITTATLIARTEDPNHPPDLPTLASASWCQEVPNGKSNVIWHTATGPCTYNTLSGKVTQVGTQ